MISFTEYQDLLESLDTKWPMTEVEPDHIQTDSHIIKFSKEDDDVMGISNRKNYSAGEYGHIITFERDGATEIHHVDHELLSDGIPKPKPANMGFVSTMFHLGREVIDSGKQLRIVGMNDGGIKHYQKLARLLGAKHGYHLSPIQPYSLNHPEAHQASEFIVKKNLSSPVIKDGYSRGLMEMVRRDSC